MKNHRINDNAFDLFVSSDNLIYTPVPRGDWDYAKDTDTGEITITFKQATAIRYLKIHFKHDDRAPLFLPADKATFLNELARTLQVYQEATSQTEEYQYDAAGNRTLLKMTLSHAELYLSEYYPNSDRLKTDGKHTYTYDNAGNMITKSDNGESWVYRYDLLNRLIEVKKNDTIIVNYKYDPSGLRVVREKPIGAKTHYVFEGTEVIFEKNISTGSIKSYVYAFGKHLARVDGKIGDAAALKYFYHTDHLGSVKAVTDQSGVVVYRADFLPFGQQYGKEKNGAFDESHGFNGKEFDEDTGLYYYNARWYDAETGRFVSEDPAGDPNSPNLYSYCGNNPLVRIDPSGESWVSDAWDAICDFFRSDGSSGDEINQSESDSSDDINDRIEEAAQRLNSSIGIFGSTQETRVDNTKTGIDGVEYKSITVSGNNAQGITVGSITIQQFVNERNETITVLTTNFFNEVEQHYGICNAQGEQIAGGQINYDSHDQKNLIGVEGFIEDTTFGALFLGTTQSGVVAGFQGSTLPRGGSRNEDGTYSTTQYKIIDEGIYEMYSHTHGGATWTYDNAIRLGAQGQGYQPGSNQITAVNAEGVSVTATQVNIHSGGLNSRSSQACQNIDPNSSWFSIGNGILTIHNVGSGGRPPSNSNGTSYHLSHQQQVDNWPTWAAFSDVMVPHPDGLETNGQFIGYYYLNRL